MEARHWCNVFAVRDRSPPIEILSVIDLNGHPSHSGSRVASASRISARSVIRSALTTGTWLKRAIWLWPILAAILLGAIGWGLRQAIEENLKRDLAQTLETILKADVAALELWWRNEEAAAQSAATIGVVQSWSEKLVAKASQPEITQLDLLQSEELKQLRAELKPFCDAGGYMGWILVDRRQKIVGSYRNELVGIDNQKNDQPYVARALEGKTTVSSPRKSINLLPANNGELKVGVPTMFAFAPIQSSTGEIIAALGLRLRPEDEFTQILGIARPGKTGETYAVNREGRLLSGSRFDAELRQMGLLTEDEGSILNLTLRDPGVDLTTNQRSKVARSQQSLTHPAQSIAEGKSGVDVSGYRDYRGVWNVGAWVWLPDYELGVVTEQDAAEAFGVLEILRMVFWSMFALLGASAVAIFIGMLVLQRKQREARQAALKLRQLGQYTLEEKLGEGGMGVVYRGHHAMLHRPTAIKFLDVQKTNSSTIARFEREVQLTAKLTHPNTIAVYDYGRTPEGIFYYAMEYLDGIDLENLVTKYGPLPEGRVIYVLQQVCGSLAEAHGIGLIHRDVKPANIFLTSRGGLFDFAKLLDFGLVRAVDEQQSARLTSAGAMAGTPLYLSPEAVEHPDQVDARSDLYAVGAVGYFLLTGTPVFDGRNIIEIVQRHLTVTPDLPSQRLGKPISAELEKLLMRCLSKSPADRPASAGELVDLLAACPMASRWSQKDAGAWWFAHFPHTAIHKRPGTPATTVLGETMISGAGSPTEN